MALVEVSVVFVVLVAYLCLVMVLAVGCSVPALARRSFRHQVFLQLLQNFGRMLGVLLQY